MTKESEESAPEPGQSEKLALEELSPEVSAYLARALPDLDRRVSRATNAGRGIRLEEEDLDLLAVCGAHETLAVAAARELKRQALRRVEERAGVKPAGKRGR